MEVWKQRLYDNYVTTGQAGSDINHKLGVEISDHPYLSNIVKRHLPNNKDISILDLACGHGKLIVCLKNIGYRNIEGVDVSGQQVKLAHDLGLTEVKCQEIEKFLIDKINSFDVIFMMDILEHLTKQELFECLDMVSQSLNTNGMVVIHVPNAEGLFGMRIRYGDMTHENCFTQQSIKQLLNVCGFKTIECFEDKPVIHGAKSFVRYILWKVLTFPFRLILLAETGSFNSILSQNMLVVAKK